MITFSVRFFAGSSNHRLKLLAGFSMKTWRRIISMRNYGGFVMYHVDNSSLTKNKSTYTAHVCTCNIGMKPEIVDLIRIHLHTCLHTGARTTPNNKKSGDTIRLRHKITGKYDSIWKIQYYRYDYDSKTKYQCIFLIIIDSAQRQFRRSHVFLFLDNFLANPFSIFSEN